MKTLQNWSKIKEYFFEAVNWCRVLLTLRRHLLLALKHTMHFAHAHFELWIIFMGSLSRALKQ